MTAFPGWRNKYLAERINSLGEKNKFLAEKNMFQGLKKGAAIWNHSISRCLWSH
jgi:hypothetical protein